MVNKTEPLDQQFITFRERNSFSFLETHHCIYKVSKKVILIEYLSFGTGICGNPNLHNI